MVLAAILPTFEAQGNPLELLLLCLFGLDLSEQEHVLLVVCVVLDLEEDSLLPLLLVDLEYAQGELGLVHVMLGDLHP